MTFQTKAMLVRLTIHAWTARKKDKNASKDVEQRAGAHDAGNFVKSLIDKEFLLPYAQHEGKIRDLHYKMTLPWSDNGDRLLPATAYMDYTQKMQVLRDEADRLADDFTKHYPTMRADARKKLGALYEPMDYPVDSDIRHRFGVELDFSPVPDAQDFRVDVAKGEIDKIKANITAGVEAKQKAATKECWDRMYAAVAKIDEVMSREKPRIFDSLIETPRELCDILPKLNFAGDKDLDAICQEVADRICSFEADDLRNDKKLHPELQRRALELMDKINAHRSGS